MDFSHGPIVMNKPLGWVIFVLATILVAAAVYFGLRVLQPPQQGKPVPPAVAPLAPEATPEPRIRYPVPAEERPLPALGKSDAAVGEAVTELLSDRSLARFFNIQEFVRRVVATVDNLPREKLAPRLMPVKPVPPPFVASGTDESAVIGSENAARYSGYVRIVEAVDAQKLVAFYVRYYPLFQQAYQELGYPKGYFNDRLVDVIDMLLATPEEKEPVRLVRPKVFYQFADPELEALPAGQKILIRMGAENSAKVKWKLREIRGELARQPPKP